MGAPGGKPEGPADPGGDGGGGGPPVGAPVALRRPGGVHAGGAHPLRRGARGPRSGRVAPPAGGGRVPGEGGRNPQRVPAGGRRSRMRRPGAQRIRRAPGGERRAVTFLRAVAVMAAKDLRLELRSKETLATMMLVAVLVLLVFVFALDPDSPSGRPADVGVLWAALVFGAAIGLGRSFARERHEGRLQAMLLAPVDRSAIFLAKWAGFTVLLLAM